ncbi:MAG: hypothetical protein KIT42_06545 [Rhodocyclaceae bacterium]|nr:hypothetical protein [Rhodocyclaceae bacterium]
MNTATYHAGEIAESLRANRATDATARQEVYRLYARQWAEASQAWPEAERQALRDAIKAAIDLVEADIALGASDKAPQDDFTVTPAADADEPRESGKAPSSAAPAQSDDVPSGMGLLFTSAMVGGAAFGIAFLVPAFLRPRLLSLEAAIAAGLLAILYVLLRAWRRAKGNQAPALGIRASLFATLAFLAAFAMAGVGDVPLPGALGGGLLVAALVTGYLTAGRILLGSLFVALAAAAVSAGMPIDSAAIILALAATLAWAAVLGWRCCGRAAPCAAISAAFVVLGGTGFLQYLPEDEPLAQLANEKADWLLQPAAEGALSVFTSMYRNVPPLRSITNRIEGIVERRVAGRAWARLQTAEAPANHADLLFLFHNTGEHAATELRIALPGEAPCASALAEARALRLSKPLPPGDDAAMHVRVARPAGCSTEAWRAWQQAHSDAELSNEPRSPYWHPVDSSHGIPATVEVTAARPVDRVALFREESLDWLGLR